MNMPEYSSTALTNGNVLHTNICASFITPSPENTWTLSLTNWLKYQTHCEQISVVVFSPVLCMVPLTNQLLKN